MTWIHLNKMLLIVGIILLGVRVGEYPIGPICGALLIAFEIVNARRMARELKGIPYETIRAYYRQDASRKYFSTKERMAGILSLHHQGTANRPTEEGA